MKKKIIIGTRGSKLALIYAKIAEKNIKKFKSKFSIKSVSIKKVTTTGDKIQNKRLSDVGGKGLFTKKIESELLNKKIDIAVHASKDIPSKVSKKLYTNCFLKRNDPREVLITRNKKKFKNLPKNSIVGTSSFRREFQLKKIRKDLIYKLIRGNVDTRINKLNNKFYDAIILSYAGLKVLGMKNKISQIFSLSEIIPSAGQGAIALQCRKNDFRMIKLLKGINHKRTNICVNAERDVLKILDGDCETPVGVNAKIQNNTLNIATELFSLDGKKRFFIKSSKKLYLAHLAGKELGEKIKKKSKNLYKKKK
ncbi:hydroxymethylbilane synthase [Candidatus Pelagibacter sp.]|nr:hydroxymethylbilane synthase [Candidatus Pelagibacter sp.]